MNARLGDCQYNDEARALIWKTNDRRYAFRPFEIRVAPIKDNEEGRKVIEEVVRLVNQIWQERDGIIPSFAEKEPPKVINLPDAGG